MITQFWYFGRLPVYCASCTKYIFDLSYINIMIQFTLTFIDQIYSDKDFCFTSQFPIRILYGKLEHIFD